MMYLLDTLHFDNSYFYISNDTSVHIKKLKDHPVQNCHAQLQM